MNKRVTGSEKERIAHQFLCKKGVRIVACNFRIRQGEIDLIGYDGRTLVFFEVKYRKNAICGSSSEAVGIGKQMQICKVAAFYRAFHHIPDDYPCRYDVVAIDGETVHWYRDAFCHRDCYGV